MEETKIIAEKLHSTHSAEVDSCGCCVVPDAIEASAKAECPESGTLSKKALHETLENLIIQYKKHLISKDVQYYYCSDSDCKIVYFSNQEAPTFSIDDLTVKVLAKDPGNDVDVCYCYDWTRGRIKDEIKETGTSTVCRDVAEKMKADNCECERKNPKGVCCLDDIQSYLKEIA